MCQIFCSAVLSWLNCLHFVSATAFAATTRRGRLFPFILIFSLFAFPGFSEHIVSPVNGKFSNRQSLVITLRDGEEAFYSYTGTDPLESGFAYDGPVLLDAGGDVNLKIAVVKGSENKSYEINYTVAEEANPFEDGSSEKSFIDKIMRENVLLCTSDNVIQIPDTLSFSIGDGEKPFLKGGTLAVSADNKLYRYIPCSVTSGDFLWRFIIYLSPLEAGIFAKSSVPFQISDWENFRFTGRNLIWCIDDGFWSASKDEIKIDRTKTHVIYWQSVAYEVGNPIESFVLSPKPSLHTEMFDKAVVLNIDGDNRYGIGIVSNGADGETFENNGIYSSLTFDTFDGDSVDATAVLSLYLDGVYQGNISVPYTIDRQPPLPPKFIASEPGEYARHDISLRVESEKKAKIYLSLSGPYEVRDNSYLDGTPEFNEIKPGEFFLYKSQPIELRAGVEKAVCYKVFSYAEDLSGNVSEVSTYQVIIDEYNYFLDSSASIDVADGSRLHPYSSFEQVLKVINSGKFVHFFVNGTVNLPKGSSVISSNCAFTGMTDARFILPPSAYIIVKDSSLEVQNCVIQKEVSSSPSDQRFFVVEKGAVSFEDCELVSNYDSSGTAISVDSSIVSFKNSVLSVQSSSYAAGISALNSKISLIESHFASVSDTAVNFSLKGGSFELRNCDCKVISHLGRIVESTGANLRLSSNKYTGDFYNPKKGMKPVWKDEKTLVLEDKNNISEGF